MPDQPSPPWLKYPELPRYDGAWQIGECEEYLLDWWAWFEDLDTNQRVEYFRQYKPLPMAWLDWIAAQFGFDAGADGFDERLSPGGIQWLEKRGLTDFGEFIKWYDDNKDHA